MLHEGIIGQMVAGIAPLDFLSPLGGRYRLLRVVEAGSDRTVYEAEDLIAGVPVFVGLVPARADSDDDAIAFARDAHRVSKLRHPNIAPLRDWGREGDDLFVVVERVDGRRLDELMRDPLDPAAARAIASTIRVALEHAHAHEVVHGHLDPDDILVSPDGEVVVSGFGLWQGTPDATPNADLERLAAICSTMAGAAPPTMPFPMPAPAGLPDTQRFQIVFDDDLPPGDHRVPALDGPRSLASVADDDASISAHAPDTKLIEAAQRADAATSPPAPTRTTRPARTEAIAALSGRPGTPTTLRGVLLRVGVLVVVVVASLAYVVAPKRVLVPDVVGTSEPAARRAAAEAGIDLASTRRVHDPLPAGVVVGSEPAQGTRLGSGERVTLIVSKGPELFAVPSVAGAAADDARAALEAAGFAIGATTLRYDDAVKEGVVIEHSGDSAMLPSGAPIDLVVSRGPELVGVPRLVGSSLTKARAALDEAGLLAGRVREVFDASRPRGSVVAQDPASGSARKGSAVDLVVSKGPEMVITPDLAGIGRTEARKRAESAGLVYAERTENSDSTGEGISMRSTPAPGSSVPKGSTVTVVFSAGPKTIAMPNLIGMSRAAAADRARGLGLVVAAENPVPGSERPAGEVVGQSPRAGTEVRKGAKVEIYYSA